MIRRKTPEQMKALKAHDAEVAALVRAELVRMAHEKWTGRSETTPPRIRVRPWRDYDSAEDIHEPRFEADFRAAEWHGGGVHRAGD